MGQGRHCSSDSDSSSSSDFSEEDTPLLNASRYRESNIQQGLRIRHYRLSALRELHGVVAQGYTAAPKNLQSCIFDDLIVAVQQSDSRPPVAAATTQLVAAAKQVLPQQKRQQLLKEHKQAAVAASRQRRKQHAGEGDDDSDDSDDGSCVALGDVPLEVVRGILQALDPLALAAAACVCRSWRDLSSSDDLWQPHLQLAFPHHSQRHCRTQPQQQQQERHVGGSAVSGSNKLQESSTGGASHPVVNPLVPSTTLQRLQGSSGCAGGGGGSADGAAAPGAHKQFLAAAQKWPHQLLPWRCCRALVQGKLQWVPPAAARSPAAAAAAARAASKGVITNGPVYVSVSQAVAWMMGGSWSEVYSGTTDDGTTTSGCSSDGEESHTVESFRKMLKLWAMHPAA